jgi:hypothetical protein
MVKVARRQGLTVKDWAEQNAERLGKTRTALALELASRADIPAPEPVPTPEPVPAPEPVPTPEPAPVPATKAQQKIAELLAPVDAYLDEHLATTKKGEVLQSIKRNKTWAFNRALELVALLGREISGTKHIHSANYFLAGSEIDLQSQLESVLQNHLDTDAKPQQLRESVKKWVAEKLPSQVETALRVDENRTSEILKNKESRRELYLRGRYEMGDVIPLNKLEDKLLLAGARVDGYWGKMLFLHPDIKALFGERISPLVKRGSAASYDQSYSLRSAHSAPLNYLHELITEKYNTIGKVRAHSEEIKREIATTVQTALDIVSKTIPEVMKKNSKFYLRSALAQMGHDGQMVKNRYPLYSPPLKDFVDTEEHSQRVSEIERQRAEALKGDEEALKDLVEEYTQGSKNLSAPQMDPTEALQFFNRNMRSHARTVHKDVVGGRPHSKQVARLIEEAFEQAINSPSEPTPDPSPAPIPEGLTLNDRQGHKSTLKTSLIEAKGSDIGEPKELAQHLKGVTHDPEGRVGIHANAYIKALHRASEQVSTGKFKDASAGEKKRGLRLLKEELISATRAEIMSNSGSMSWHVTGRSGVNAKAQKRRDRANERSALRAKTAQVNWEQAIRKFEETFQSHDPQFKQLSERLAGAESWLSFVGEANKIKKDKTLSKQEKAEKIQKVSLEIRGKEMNPEYLQARLDQRGGAFKAEELQDAKWSVSSAEHRLKVKGYK